MKFKVLTLPMDPANDQFDGSALETEMEGASVVRLDHYLVDRPPGPRLVLILGYEPEDTGAAGSDTAATPTRASRRRDPTAWRAKLAEGDRDLFETLRVWRNATAVAQEEPGYRIVTNAALAAVAALRPRTQPELLNVPGVGPQTVLRWGEDLLEVVRSDDSEAASGATPLAAGAAIDPGPASSGDVASTG